jgi:hypothetical protein
VVEVVELERVGRAEASVLAAQLTRELDVAAELHGDDPCRVEIRADCARLASVLGTVERWASRAGIASVSVRLNGRSYVLECRAVGWPPADPALP